MGRFCVQKKLDAFANLYGGEISGKILFITLFRKNRNFARNTTPVDIPDSWDWDPRAQQQPTGLIAAPAAQGRAVRLLIAGATKTRTPPPQRGRGVLFLVEAMGVEPMSEKSSV